MQEKSNAIKIQLIKKFFVNEASLKFILINKRNSYN